MRWSVAFLWPAITRKFQDLKSGLRLPLSRATPRISQSGSLKLKSERKTEFTWATQEVLVEAKSYQPNRINVDLSEPHSISGSLGSLEIDAELADLSVLFKPNLQLSLGSLEALFKNLTLSFKGLPDAEVETMSARLDASPNTEKNYQVIAQIENLNLSNLMIGHRQGLSNSPKYFALCRSRTVSPFRSPGDCQWHASAASAALARSAHKLRRNVCFVKRQIGA